MAEQGSTGQSWVGRIAGVIVVVILIIGGYFALTARPGPKPEQTVDVAIVPPAGTDAAAKPAAAPAADQSAATPQPASPAPAAPAPVASVPAAPPQAPAAAPATPGQAAAPAAPPATDQAAAPASPPADQAAAAPAATNPPAGPAAANPPAAAAEPAVEPPAAANPVDAAANLVNPSEPVPSEPVPSAAASPGASPAGEPAAPSFDVVRVEPNGDAVVAGRSEPNATVEILSDSAPIASGQANDRGEWAVTTDAPLAPGAHDLTIRTTSPDRKTETLSEQSVAVNVPDNPKAGPLVVLDTPDGASKVLQVPPGAKSSGAGQTGAGKPAAGTAAVSRKPEVTVDAVAFQDGKLFISGSAAIGGTVRIYVDGVAIGDSTVDGDGRWVIETKRDVGTGRHTIRADRIDNATGGVVARAEVPFEQNGDVATLMAVTTEGGGSAGGVGLGDVPSPKSVIIRRGDNLWTISKRLYGHGVRFSTIYEANTDQIRDPDMIYPGQKFLLPAGDTRWTE